MYIAAIKFIYKQFVVVILYVQCLRTYSSRHLLNPRFHKTLGDISVMYILNVGLFSQRLVEIYLRQNYGRGLNYGNGFVRDVIFHDSKKQYIHCL